MSDHLQPWFRVYGSLVDDPKVQKLPGDLVKALLNIWCIASQNNGALPAIGDVAFKLRMTEVKAAEVMTKLCGVGLLDNVDGVFTPHNWRGRQYKSDVSTERVKRFRERSKGAPETPSETDQSRAEQNRAEQNRAEHSRAKTAPRAAFDDEKKGQQSDIVERVLKSDLMDIFGEAKCPDLSRAAEWIAKGYAPSMVIEVVEEIYRRKPGVASLAYFDSALAERHARRPEAPSERAAREAAADMDAVVAFFAKTRSWSRYAGPEPGQIGCRASPELLAKHGLDPSGEKLKKRGEAA